MSLPPGRSPIHSQSAQASSREAPVLPRKRVPVVPPPVDPSARPPTWRQGVLLVATFVTLSIAGGSFWALERPGPRDWLELLGNGLGFAVATVAVLGAHEMGHFVACRFHRIPATWPYFIPGIPPFGTFGAIIRIRGRIPSRAALFDVAAAGPIAGFAVAIPLMAYGLATAEPSPVLSASGVGIQFGRPLIGNLLGWLLGIEGNLSINSYYGAGWFGMLITALNLFPVGQLDGGHAVYSVSRRLHRLVSWATIFSLAGLLVGVVFWTRQLPGYILWLAILFWMRHRHPPLLDESVPLSAGRRRLLWVLAAIFLLTFTPVPITFV